MLRSTDFSCTAFADAKKIAAGKVLDVAIAVKRFMDSGANTMVLIFDDRTSHPVEIDFRGSEDEVRAKVGKCFPEIGSAPIVEVAETKGPGRPKLGVIAKEVTLLPSHWQWLSEQPGGASVVLRKLVENAKKANADKDRIRLAQESTYRFMSALGGNCPGFEEATRALFSGNKDLFIGHLAAWPPDLREHALLISQLCFAD